MSRAELFSKSFKCVVFVFFLCFLSSCGTQAVYPVCRHKVIYCAMLYSDLRGVPVRLAVGYRFSSDGCSYGLHTQAQAYIDGKWQWLVMDREVCMVGGKDLGFRPEYYIPLTPAFLFWIKDESMDIKDFGSGN